MKFLKVHLIGKEGTPGGFFWVNPERIVGIAVAMVPGELSGPTGVPISNQKAALDLGDKMIVVDESPEEMVMMLEKFFREKIK